MIQRLNKLAVLVTVLAFASVPMMTGGSTAVNTSVESVVGSTCLVPIFHTNFSFPPEGGKIVRIGNGLYFVQDYRPECADAGANGQLIKGSQQSAISTANMEQNITNTSQNNPNCMYQLQ